MMININVINNLKRDRVKNICNIVSDTDIVKRMFIFGSAVTKFCSEESDIDICVDTECPESDMRLYDLYTKISRTCDFNCDILTYHKLSDALRCEIDEKGVMVYESVDKTCGS